MIEVGRTDRTHKEFFIGATYNINRSWAVTLDHKEIDGLLFTEYESPTNPHWRSTNLALTWTF